MKPFTNEQLETIEIESNKFKEKIPVIVCKPRILTDDSNIFIFSNGLSGNNTTAQNMNYPFFESNYLISYEKAGHGNNKNKPSQRIKFYLKELDEVVNWVKSNFSNRKIYLIGESWGSNIGFVYYFKNKKKVDGCVAWNMPCKIVDISGKKGKQKFITSFKTLISLVLNISTFDNYPSFTTDKLSTNKVLIRLKKIETSDQFKLNFKSSLAVWKFGHKSWKQIIKNANRQDLNFIYIQSKNDVLADWKKWNKLSNKDTNKIHSIFLDDGHHILSFETNMTAKLFDEVQKIIK